MRRFWLFRSNIRHLEYYHEFRDLETFKKKCHDYYMLFPLWLLEKGYFDEVTIWRLTNKSIDSTIRFNVNGKKYIQRWVNNFHDTLRYPPPEMSFWRGGFPEYDFVTRDKPEHFGKKIYLGAGRRVFPQWGGKYDMFLMEDERDIIKNANCVPFYKTASPQIFHPLKKDIKWDICWPCNFTQLKYKGQKLFISQISKDSNLQRLKIAHCGNESEVGKDLCTKFGVSNIKFFGYINRERLNELLNESKFGLNLSNDIDGCPRVSTEILMSGAPLIIRDKTRLLKDFRKKGVVEVCEKNIPHKVMWALDHYSNLKNDVADVINSVLSFDHTNQKNIDIWKKM
jgi:hypothetical protein